MTDHPTGARLEGKVALITGGARGMGASHARAMIAQGAKVVVADVLDAEGVALATELGDAAHSVHLDVTDRVQWATAVATTVERYGKLNVLVNNAGIANFGAIGTGTTRPSSACAASPSPSPSTSGHTTCAATPCTQGWWPHR
jgi:3alpha(or 20beta)-hydroxysteroid dehydrogenase